MLRSIPYGLLLWVMMVGMGCNAIVDFSAQKDAGNFKGGPKTDTDTDTSADTDVDGDTDADTDTDTNTGTAPDTETGTETDIDTYTGTDTDTNTNTDTDSDVNDNLLKSTCKQEERVGAFAIYLAEDYTNISGAVSTGVKPIGVPEVLAREGSCSLLGQRSLFCDPGCSLTETCGFDETCIEAPLKQSAGIITLDGLKIPASIEPNGITFDYGKKITDPFPAFDDGTRITLTAEGGDYEPFTLTGFGPKQIVSNSPEVMVDRDTPVSVQWTPDNRDETQIRLNLTLNVHGATTGWIVCDAPDTGSFEIPASLVTQLIDLGLSGFPKIDLIRHSIDTTTIAEGCVEFTIYSLFKLDVQVAGMVSCKNDSDCDTGQVCNAELVCEDK